MLPGSRGPHFAHDFALIVTARNWAHFISSLSRELLSQRSKVQGIPTLKSEHGEWAHAPADKADLIARTLDGKNVLPIQLKNQYSYVEANRYKQKGLKSLQQKSSAEVLQALCEQSGTGPDLLPARILKNCASQLCPPLCKTHGNPQFP